mmetsp:Transcript_206/g.576  ORF Transcript_206/g.576 Transcript_206/m.576 type:complete len:422 (+) Transcript_206:836-2101(+)
MPMTPLLRRAAERPATSSERTPVKTLLRPSAVEAVPADFAQVSPPPQPSERAVAACWPPPLSTAMPNLAHNIRAKLRTSARKLPISPCKPRAKVWSSERTEDRASSCASPVAASADCVRRGEGRTRRPSFSCGGSQACSSSGSSALPVAGDSPAIAPPPSAAAGDAAARPSMTLRTASSTLARSSVARSSKRPVCPSKRETRPETTSSNILCTATSVDNELPQPPPPSPPRHPAPRHPPACSAGGTEVGVEGADSRPVRRSVGAEAANGVGSKPRALRTGGVGAVEAEGDTSEVAAVQVEPVSVAPEPAPKHLSASRCHAHTAPLPPPEPPNECPPPGGPPSHNPPRGREGRELPKSLHAAAEGHVPPTPAVCGLLSSRGHADCGKQAPHARGCDSTSTGSEAVQAPQPLPPRRAGSVEVA